MKTRIEKGHGSEGDNLPKVDLQTTGARGKSVNITEPVRKKGKMKKKQTIKTLRHTRRKKWS